MQVEFASAVMITLLVTVLPGYFALRLLGASRVMSFACSPMFTFAVVPCVGIILSLAGVEASGLLVLLGCLAFSLLFLVSFVARKTGECSPSEFGKVFDVTFSWKVLLLYILFACIAYVYVYLRHLNSLDFLVQGYDTVFHVGLVRSIMDSCDYSCLHVSLYPEGSQAPFFDQPAGFYPASWHCVAAVVAELSGASVALAANALNFVLCAVVFPSGLFALMGELFGEGSREVWIGALCSMAFYEFPWAILIRGEQFPQLLAFSLAPAAMFAFALLLKNLRQRKMRIEGLVFFAMSLIALVFSQTNAVFTVGIFIAPCVINAAASTLRKSSCSLFKCVIVAFVLSALFILMWLALFFAPFLKGIVEFTWPAFSTPSQAILRLVSFSLPKEGAPQLILSSLVFVGFVALAMRPEKRWILFPFAFSSLMYVACVSSDGVIKHILSGFWYTDPDRVSAMVAIFSMPLAAAGLSCAVGLVANAARQKISERIVLVVVCICFVASIFYPRVVIMGRDFGTAIGYAQDKVIRLNDPSFVSVLDRSEDAFARKAIDMIPEGALVLNVPSDGSSFLYGLYGTNLYYKRDYFGTPQETEDSLNLRYRLYDIASDDRVRESVDRVGVRYLLLLDRAMDGGEEGILFHTYREEDWSGFESVQDDTPGFEVLLADGDMRLYRIEAS